jgi:hypothetical protein
MFTASVADERQQPEAFDVIAYLASVAVGCALAGALLPLSDLFLGYNVRLESFLLWPLVTLLGGFLPCLVLCLPAVLSSFWISRRLHLVAPAWKAFFGGATGLWMKGILSALGMSFTATVELYQVAVLTIAGAVAGIVYHRVKILEQKLHSKG